MSLRQLETKNGSGGPITVVIQTRAEVSFSNAYVTILAVSDDGVSITASLAYANGTQFSLVLFTGIYYQKISHFSDGEINARILELIPCSC